MVKMGKLGAEDAYTQSQIELLSKNLKEIQTEDYPEIYNLELDNNPMRGSVLEVAKILKTIDPMLANNDMLFIFHSANNPTALTKVVNYLVEKLRVHENYRLVDIKHSNSMAVIEGYNEYDYSVCLQFKSTS